MNQNEHQALKLELETVKRQRDELFQMLKELDDTIDFKEAFESLDDEPHPYNEVLGKAKDLLTRMEQEI
ncbi:hypothetical protein ACFYKX_10835 [Cytobacillus sp. FJAT-54145]|uniref:Uncharacterized protein n=1 Tax=Cytobacillus spartinae TaxID=3299023 RepID=A0ABW6KCV1_9BACI